MDKPGQRNNRGPICETSSRRTADKRAEAKVRHHQDRADRAERWLYKIWVEVEQKFFGGDAVRLSEPPSTHSETR